MSKKEYVLYILECADGTLYTGITNHLSKRIQQHERGNGAKYTRGRGPFSLVWTEEGLTRSEALVREREIKKLSRRQKLAMIGKGMADDATKKF
ncbi:MAG: GIY-YIG nuclease family protein [Firmicutes bacterium]|uniref:Putative endonuclease n=1 Tax=Melghirimyces thermohalophilus TaxID=1236220 RepID=A0A1G6PZH3_9BACL|nr:GIY-YIG nuclease family protein [Melghirimyces thermohalophilus]MDA8354187.1 GIY-YIG nuclease family protein [Bacillota bacterium]SDC85590.1 putative endonuclease [Melghirimyces thermohalophilus]